MLDYMSMNILITGGAGFVGSSLGILLKKNYTNYSVIALDNLKRRGSELNISRLKHAGIQFVHGDIRNKEDLEIFPEIDVIIEASAEPSVLAGINSTPDYLINTNLNGTVNCLNLAVKRNAKFIFLSTSRVYPINNIDKINSTELATRFELTPNQFLPGVSIEGINEQFPIEGYRSLYGATKLSSELLINEYHHFYGLKSIINRCGVLTGPWQMGKTDQGVVVLWVARHFWKAHLKYIGFGGSGKQVRDILHIYDLYRLIDTQLHHFEDYNGQTFNVGGGHKMSVSLLELTKLCQKVTGNEINIFPEDETRQADIKTYVTDNSKISAISQWHPEISPEQMVEDIYQWLIENEHQLKDILN